MRGIAILAAAALIGCGEDPAVTPDGPVEPDGPPPPCWPELTTFPQGSATLGTGPDGGAFETMPDMLPIAYGTQDGFMLYAHARMTGFAPGNPQDVLDRSNPRTRIRAFFADNNVPLNALGHCPFRYGYVPAGNGQYELVHSTAVIFDTCWRSDNLLGRQVRIELEIMDDSGGYATDMKMVTLAPPSGPYPMDENSPGCLP